MKIQLVSLVVQVYFSMKLLGFLRLVGQYEKAAGNIFLYYMAADTDWLSCNLIG